MRAFALIPSPAAVVYSACNQSRTAAKRAASGVGLRFKPRRLQLLATSIVGEIMLFQRARRQRARLVHPTKSGRIRRPAPATPASSSSYQELERRNLLAQLLPDVFPWADESRGYMYDWGVEGNLLRFSTAFANQGLGHLELRGGQVLPNGNQQVHQRIYNDDGTFSDRLAGEFTYHPGHGHIHFDGYAKYDLKVKTANGGVGNTVATGGKISFCLIDITKYRSNAGPSRYNSCGQVQGVTAGWSDVYSRGLPDQYINISNVPDGEYWLEVTIDPDRQLLESNPDNNTTRIPILLNRGGSAGGDRFEPNNSFATAMNYGTISQRVETGLSVHSATDLDYFLVTAAEQGEFHIETVFSNALGNLDLYVYDEQFNLIASETTDHDNEHLHFDGLKGDSYYILIKGAEGATNAYDLQVYGPGNIITDTVHGTGLPLNIPDASGGNPGAWVHSTLSGPEIQLTDLNVVFNRLDHSWLGDLEVRLTSPSGRVATLLKSQFQSGGGLLGSQDNFLNTVMDDQRLVNLANGTAPFTGSYNINHASIGNNPLSVFNGEIATGTWRVSIRDWAGSDVGKLYDWSLMFTGIDLNPGDEYEPNNSFPQAVNLGMLGEVSQTGLSIHKPTDRDFYRFQAGASTTAELRVLWGQPSVNLDFILYDSSLSEIARSESLSGDEILPYEVVANETYYLEVFGAGGSTSNYTLEIDVAPVIGTSGWLTAVTDQWRQVSFDRSYQSPVVIVSPPAKNDGTPTTVRVRNVTATGFEVRLDNWEYLGDSHAGEDLGYLVVEAGRHLLADGRVITAGTQSGIKGSFQQVGFSQAFAWAPTVFAQVASANEPVAVVPRLQQIRRDGFQVRLQQQEANVTRLSDGEQVHWLAIESGSEMDGAWQYQAGISRVPNESLFTRSLSAGFRNLPTILAGVQTYKDRDPVNVRLADVKANTFNFHLEEEQSRDAEQTHGGEVVAWLAFSGQQLFGQRPNEFGGGGPRDSGPGERGPGELGAGGSGRDPKSGKGQQDGLMWGDKTGSLRSGDEDVFGFASGKRRPNFGNPASTSNEPTPVLVAIDPINQSPVVEMPIPVLIAVEPITDVPGGEQPGGGERLKGERPGGESLKLSTQQVVDQLFAAPLAWLE